MLGREMGINGCVAQNEDNHFSKAVHYDMYGIVALFGERESGDEVRGHNFPWSCWDLSWLCWDLGLLVCAFVGLTECASRHIALDVLFHTWPSEVFANSSEGLLLAWVSMDQTIVE